MPKHSMKSKMGMKSKMATKKRGGIYHGGSSHRAKMTEGGKKKKKMGPKGYARGGVVNPSYSEVMPKATPN